MDDASAESERDAAVEIDPSALAALGGDRLGRILAHPRLLPRDETSLPRYGRCSLSYAVAYTLALGNFVHVYKLAVVPLDVDEGGAERLVLQLREDEAEVVAWFTDFALPALLRAMADDNPRMALVLEQLHAPDEASRSFAARAAGKFGLDSARERLLELLDPSRYVPERYGAALAFIGLRDERSVPLLRHAVQDEKLLRYNGMFAYALGHYECGEFLDEICGWFRNAKPGWEVQVNAYSIIRDTIARVPAAMRERCRQILEEELGIAASGSRGGQGRPRGGQRRAPQFLACCLRPSAARARVTPRDRRRAPPRLSSSR